MAEGAGETVTHHKLIGIKDSRIVKISDWTDSGWVAKEYIDAGNRLVMPGLINGHSHLPMTLFRGLADDLPFEEWLKNYIFPLEARLVSPEFCRLGSELAAVEALLLGTTTILDMYYFESSVAEACDSIGIRALVGESFIDFPAPDNKKMDGSDWRVMDELRERFGSHSRIHPILAPHAPYTVGDATFAKVRDYALKHDLKVTVHVSETIGEVEASKKQYGKTPLKRLFDLGLLDAKVIMAHCVHLTDEEIVIAAKQGATIVHNPESNMKLGAGAAPIKKLIEAGIAVGIGTDGPASNNDLNLFNEMDSAAKLQKLVHHDNTAMTAIMALRMATRLGARALGMEKEIGTLEVGKKADLIIVDPWVPHMQPIHNLCSQLVYASTGREVDTVIVDGRVVVRDRKPVFCDNRDLFERIHRFREKNKF